MGKLFSALALVLTAGTATAQQAPQAYIRFGGQVTNTVPVNGSFSVEGTHADGPGIGETAVGFRLYRNGVELVDGPSSIRIAGKVTFPFPNGWSAGTYAIVIGAYNSTGGEGRSEPISLTVADPAPPPPDPVWTFCGNEWETCPFTGTKEVRYGAGTTYFFRTLTGGTECTNAVFGDPISGTWKHCDYRDVPPPPTTPVNCVVSAWAFQSATAWSACSGGTQTRSETWTRTVTTQPANGGTACPALAELRTASQACTTPAPTPSGMVSTTSCTWVLKDTSPFTGGGGSVQFRIINANGTFTNIGSVSTGSYSRSTVAMPVGTYQISALWTKSGVPSVVRDPKTYVCQ